MKIKYIRVPVEEINAKVAIYKEAMEASTSSEIRAFFKGKIDALQDLFTCRLIKTSKTALVTEGAKK